MLLLTQRVDTPAHITATLTLPIDIRVKSRAKVQLNDGREAGLMLPRGLLLRGGDCLSTEDGAEVVEIIAASEAVSVVRCARRAALSPRSRAGYDAAPVQSAGDVCTFAV